MATSLTSFSDPVYDLMSQVSPSMPPYAGLGSHAVPYQRWSFSTWCGDWSLEQLALLLPSVHQLVLAMHTCHAFSSALHCQPCYKQRNSVLTRCQCA